MDASVVGSEGLVEGVIPIGETGLIGLVMFIGFVNV
jgi:hypothetical protein